MKVEAFRERTRSDDYRGRQGEPDGVRTLLVQRWKALAV